MGFSCSFFNIVHKSCLCTKFQITMSKVSHLNFSSNTHFFVKNTSSANPYFLVHHFHCCLTGNAFWHIYFSNLSHLPDSILSIHFFVCTISFSNPFFFLHQFNCCLTGNTFYHIKHIITNAICLWLAAQQHNKTTSTVLDSAKLFVEPVSSTSIM
jgi:hypothetical protein